MKKNIIVLIFACILLVSCKKRFDNSSVEFEIKETPSRFTKEELQDAANVVKEECDYATIEKLWYDKNKDEEVLEESMEDYDVGAKEDIVELQSVIFTGDKPAEGFSANVEMPYNWILIRKDGKWTIRTCGF